MYVVGDEQYTYFSLKNLNKVLLRDESATGVSKIARKVCERINRENSGERTKLA